ncbi:MAG: type II toxin-antitoxin system RelE/ParE family toxin [Bacteroidaceae bacterium]|nr:type II toxin-antitoxin system RelE/ParE family toxin [Bacteroidaceae bacterium]
MNCNIYATPDFARSLKRLAKRYASMHDDYAAFLEALRENPLMGTELGHHLRKVRFPIASKGRGKSGGARVITHTILLQTDGADVTLVAIYDKSDRANITDKEIRQLLRNNGL